MLLVDDQSGSKDLFPFIERLTPEAIMTRIEPPYGDMVWVGNGPEDLPLRVAVEYKQLPELLDSMVSGRFGGHQVEGLVNHYDRRYLLVEMGRHRLDRNTGNLMIQSGRDWYPVKRNGRVVTSADLEHAFTTYEEQAQFRVKLTDGRHESARWVYDKYTWYTRKGWDDHKALQQFHVPPPPTMQFIRPNIMRRIAKELFKLGWDKSAAAATHFRTVREMINADEKRWMEIDGIGKVIAHEIVREVSQEVK